MNWLTWVRKPWGISLNDCFPNWTLIRFVFDERTTFSSTSNYYIYNIYTSAEYGSGSVLCLRVLLLMFLQLYMQTCCFVRTLGMRRCATPCFSIQAMHLHTSKCCMAQISAWSHTHVHCKSRYTLQLCKSTMRNKETNWVTHRCRWKHLGGQIQEGMKTKRLGSTSS